MEEQKYIDLVKRQIELDKLLHSVKKENIDKAKLLFEKKEEIMKKNGFFADILLKNVNKKINKLKWRKI